MKPLPMGLFAVPPGAPFARGNRAGAGGGGGGGRRRAARRTRPGRTRGTAPGARAAVGAGRGRRQGTHLTGLQDLSGVVEGRGGAGGAWSDYSADAYT